MEILTSGLFRVSPVGLSGYSPRDSRTRLRTLDGMAEYCCRCPCTRNIPAFPQSCCPIIHLFFFQYYSVLRGGKQNQSALMVVQTELNRIGVSWFKRHVVALFRKRNNVG